MQSGMGRTSSAVVVGALRWRATSRLLASSDRRTTRARSKKTKGATRRMVVARRERQATRTVFELMGGLFDLAMRNERREREEGAAMAAGSGSAAAGSAAAVRPFSTQRFL